VGKDRKETLKERGNLELSARKVAENLTEELWH
jgi:hypothetical protein